ncbi:hypothetical protein CASFOL_014814 [Castilleja foliolosa]|uniref:V-type proton ATPase subunit G n=1 Tax=Castilleja foliolosa TaxID=1961234 RepID=A0ABD3DBX4_9LAMI
MKYLLLFLFSHFYFYRITSVFKSHFPLDLTSIGIVNLITGHLLISANPPQFPANQLHGPSREVDPYSVPVEKGHGGMGFGYHNGLISYRSNASINALMKNGSYVIFLIFILIPCFTVSLNMASSSSQNGIQLLLTAEQEAQHIVNVARNAKQARLKQAKEEAEKEIAGFRSQVEADYQRKVAESSGDSGANVKRLELETGAKIQHLKTEASRISLDVVSMLRRQVTTLKN